MIDMTPEPATVYVVIDVMSGIAVGAMCFRSGSDAEAYADMLRSHRSPNDDDVQVFVCALNSGSDSA